MAKRVQLREHGAMELVLQAGPNAFGDAGHPTTKLMLEALGALAPNLAPERVCDMGAGSGILSLAAARLWPDAEIIAVELERQAIGVIEENARANELEAHIIARHSDGFRDPIIEQHAPYDVILMNILAEPILRLLADADKHLADQGLLLLSGMMAHQQQVIIEAAQSLGLELTYRLSLEGWVTQAWQKG